MASIYNDFLSSSPLPRNFAVAPTLGLELAMWLPPTNDILANIKQAKAPQP